MMENNDEIYVIYQDGHLWSGDNASARKVRGYATKAIAQGVIMRKVKVDARKIVDEKGIAFWDSKFTKEYELTIDNQLSRYQVKTFVEKNL